MRLLLGGLAVSVGLYLLLLLAAYVFQRQLLYLPSDATAPEAALVDAGFAYRDIPVPGVGSVAALWRAPVDDTAPVFLFMHGNAGAVGDRLPILAMLAQDGAGVLGVGYPGYGGNPGSPSEDSLFGSARTHFDWLAGQGIAPGRIMIFGQSLGSGPAVWLASETAAAGLILEAPYTGMDDIAQRQFPIFPARWLVSDRYRNSERIGAIGMPLLWVHGERDSLIPFAMGRQLFDAAHAPKTALPVAAGGHNDLWLHGIDGPIRDWAKAQVTSE